MRTEIKQSIAAYAITDFITAAVSWVLFLFITQLLFWNIEAHTFFQTFSRKDYINTLVCVPSFWLIIHLFSGAYFNLYRKSRIIEIYRTFISIIIGSIFLFFFFIVRNKTNDYSYYYKAYFIYFIIHFLCTSFGRMLVLFNVKNKINKHKFGYNTLIIGGNQNAIALYQELINNHVSLGNIFKGFVYADDTGKNGMSSYLPKLGSINQLEKIIDQHEIEEVVIAIDTSEHNRLQHILAQLSHRPVVIKITADLYDIISGSVKTSNVFAAVLIEIYPELMPDWQRVIKRAIDICISFLILVCLSPLYIFAALKVRLSSPGSIFYKQQRIGIYGKPFWIYKFRSMLQNAEDNGPALSSENDPRITPWGKIMRKWRIDEIPQFYNILKGEMSLVGPRPERKYFIDIISEKNPHYKYLHKVKPGLSSWGMVKFGYAENTQEMIERMKYDLLYIKNCSLALDIKIMLYTLKVILQGRGK